MKHLIIISILLIIIVSCGKKTQIKVTAKNAATGEGFSGLDFRLMEVKPPARARLYRVRGGTLACKMIILERKRAAITPINHFEELNIPLLRDT